MKNSSAWVIEPDFDLHISLDGSDAKQLLKKLQNLGEVAFLELALNRPSSKTAYSKAFKTIRFRKGSNPGFRVYDNGEKAKVFLGEDFWQPFNEILDDIASQPQGSIERILTSGKDRIWIWPK